MKAKMAGNKFRIGEFSYLTSISVKALRLYHEKGLLVPAVIDDASGYRYYDARNLETARCIRALKEFDFSLTEIKALLDECSDEAEMLAQLEAKLREVQDKIGRYEDLSRLLTSTIQAEKEAEMTEDPFDIEEKTLETVLIAGYRMRGKYSDIGTGLARVCKAMARHGAGKPMGLYHEDEYKEEDADFEACLPVRKGKSANGIEVRELPGGRCVSLLHKGPYENLKRSYGRVFAYVNDKGYRKKLPFREVYAKGPGMIFKGKPKNYLTEIQVLIEE